MNNLLKSVLVLIIRILLHIQSETRKIFLKALPAAVKTYYDCLGGAFFAVNCPDVHWKFPNFPNVCKLLL